jgi:hypothetical protein
MGLPNINVAFKQAGTTAIERGERGIVALILKDSTNNGLLTTTDVSEIPDTLSAYNQKQLKDAWVGNVQPPSEVIAYVEPTEATDYSEAMAALEVEQWDYISVPGIGTTDATTVSTWVKGLRDNKDIKVKSILPNTASDHEGVINFATDNIVVTVTNGDGTTTTTTYAAKDYCARIAGLIAGTPLTQSATYSVLSEVTDIPHLSKAEFDDAIDAGKFVLMNDGKKVKVARAVNSLTTVTADKGSDYQKIKLVDIMDMINKDVKTTVEDYYIGKFPNTYSNKCLLLTAIDGYFDTISTNNTSGNLIESDYTADIDVASQKTYLKSNGIDVNSMTTKQLKEANTGDKVFLAGSVSILDAIEDFNFNIGI